MNFFIEVFNQLPPCLYKDERRYDLKITRDADSLDWTICYYNETHEAYREIMYGPKISEVMLRMNRQINKFYVNGKLIRQTNNNG